jgi:hypothetical protein
MTDVLDRLRAADAGTSDGTFAIVTTQTILDAITEIERLKDEGLAILDTIGRLMDAGYYFGKQNGKRWLWNAKGEGVAYGETFRELCVNIVLMGL